VDVKRRLLRSHPPSDDSQKVRSGDENWQGLIAPIVPPYEIFYSFQPVEEFIEEGIVFAVLPSRDN
jgi:hypothetical protein